VTSTRFLFGRRVAIVVPLVAGLVLVGCGSDDDAPDTSTNDGAATTLAPLGGEGVPLEPGSNQPPDETPSDTSDGDAGDGDTMIEGTLGPDDQGVPDAGSTASVPD